MDYLVIHFADAGLGEFRWALLDGASESAALDWKDATESDLPKIAAGHRDPVIFLIPQQCVYLTQVELPKKASRQVLAAIEFQVEEQLAQDIESQHFALGDTSANPIAVAVVEKSIMAACQTLARTQGLQLHQVLPELFLCPWSGSGVNLIEGYQGYLLRYGDNHGFKCNAATLAAMLKLVRREVEFESVLYYHDDNSESELPRLDGIRVEQKPLDSTPCGLLDSPVIDLQQREFQLSSAWQALARVWQWVALLMAVLLAIGAYNKAIALQQFEDELTAIKDQQYQLLKSYLPSATTRDSNLKKLLIARLKQDQSSQSEQGFLQLLADFTQVRKQFDAVQITRIHYQKKRLSIDITSKQLKDIEALHRQIGSSEISARLENLNIKPEQISARLVLQGDSDG